MKPPTSSRDPKLSRRPQSHRQAQNRHRRRCRWKPLRKATDWSNNRQRATDNSMTFAHPYFLLLLLLLPLLAWLKGKVGFQPAFLYSSVQLVRGITGITRSRAGAILAKMRWLALALFFIALARPQVGEGETRVTASGVDIVVAIDLSGSMSSEDFELQGQRVNQPAI